MSEKYKKVFIAFLITLGISIVAFSIIFISYSEKLKSSADFNIASSNVIEDIVDNEKSSLASSSEDKTVNDVKNNLNNNIAKNTPKNLTKENTSKSVLTATQNKEKNTVNSENKASLKDEKKEEKTEKKASFIAPASGEIITDYADENLVYSKTLEEWTTHLGVDIKADKTSIVVASEDGTVKSIKNDPRYGLTITLSHDDGFETVYSNLLSTEFVKEGDKVTKGQTIATVGDSASFEVAEESHLHFEMYKDGKNVNPTTFLEKQ